MQKPTFGIRLSKVERQRLERLASHYESCVADVIRRLALEREQELWPASTPKRRGEK